MRKALIVGIDEYPNAMLNGCVNDANVIAELLRKNGDGSPNFDILIKENIQSKNELKNNISELFRNDTEISLLYFSGHGCTTETGSYIVTPDYQQGSEGVSMDEILKIVNSSPAKNKVIIFDCCYSGKFGNNPLSDKYTEISSGVTILTASDENQAAQETGGHGVFTNLLIDALNGGASNINGQITPGSVYAHIDQALDSWEQRPLFKTNIKGFVSLRKIIPKIDMDVLRKITEYFPSSTSNHNMDPSYEYTNDSNYKIELKKPYADLSNVSIMKNLQKMESIGLVEPVDEEHMYFAAMNSKSCKLTALGNHYWNLVKKGRI